MFDAMNKIIEDFFNESDKFINKYKGEIENE